MTTKGDTMKAKREKFIQVEFGSLANGDKYYASNPKHWPSVEEWIKVGACSGLSHYFEGGSLCTGDWIIYPSKGVADLVWVRVK